MRIWDAESGASIGKPFKYRDVPPRRACNHLRLLRRGESVLECDDWPSLGYRKSVLCVDSVLVAKATAEDPITYLLGQSALHSR